MRNIFKRTIPPLEHPRIKNRTPEQQKYRDELANNLKADRALGEVGKPLAEDRLEKEQKSENYILAKYGFTQKGARELIKAEEGEVVAENIKSFEGVYHNEIAKLLIEAKKGWGWDVVKYIEHFEGVDHNEIAKLLIKIGSGRVVAENIKKFKGLDAEIAKILIGEEGGRYGGSRVAKYIKHFVGVDHNEITKLLIEAGRGKSVVCWIENFEGVDYNEIMKLLILSGQLEDIIGMVRDFKGLNVEIAKMFIERNQIRYLYWKLKHFEGLDVEIAKMLIEIRGGSDVAENIKSFEGVDHNEIAKLLIEAGEGRNVARYIKHFKGLNAEIVKMLIELGYTDEIRQSIKSSDQSEV